jgi:hypothetical protein
MGKRELLIIAAFGIVGMIAYQVAAPHEASRPGRLSLANVIGSIRRVTRDNRVVGSATTTGTIPAADALSQLIVSDVSTLTVTGEPRADIAYTLTVQSSGKDASTAQQLAGRANLEPHDAGSVLSLGMTFVRDVRQTATLVLRVPSRLGVRVEGLPGSIKVDIDTVASVDLEGVVGDVDIRNVVHGVTGAHRNGDLTIGSVGAIRLNVVSSELKASNGTGPATVVARNGHARFDGPRGPIDIDGTSVETIITSPTNVVHVSATGGSVSIERPAHTVTVDAHRASVTLTLASATPATVFTTDAPLHVTLDGAPDALDLTIDATATSGGAIDAGDVGLTSEVKGSDTRFTHAFGRGSARVALFDERGTIVIRQSK